MSGASVRFFRPRTQSAELSKLTNPPLQSGFRGYRSKREEPDPYLVKGIGEREKKTGLPGSDVICVVNYVTRRGSDDTD